MKEEETKKVASGSAQISFSPADDELDRSFEHILNNSAVPRTMPAVIRTKKAESRMAACSPSPVMSKPLNSVEQRAMEHQKRQEWRQARFKSLEADSKAAEEVMQQVEQINSRLANIAEEISNSPLPVNEKILQNETSFERNEYIDPITGAATVSLVEKSFTQREVN
uniref:BZIP domain-containing protein n=1 Tax=Elaeophora elaphi TaxID=1147741 RepID=A0A0R3S5A6_9BILA